MVVKDKELTFDYFNGVMRNEKETKIVPAKKANTIVWAVNRNSLYNIVIVDINQRKIYFSDWANITFDARFADYSGDLTKDNYHELLMILKLFNPEKWDRIYEGTIGDSTGRFEWCLNIEARGKVERHFGFGCSGNNKPGNFNEFDAAIIDFALKHTSKTDSNR